MELTRSALPLMWAGEGMLGVCVRAFVRAGGHVSVCVCACTYRCRVGRYGAVCIVICTSVCYLVVCRHGPTGEGKFFFFTGLSSLIYSEVHRIAQRIDALSKGAMVRACKQCG